MSLIIDIAFSLPEDIQTSLERKIRQIVCEPPKTLFFVQVRIVDTSVVGESVFGNVYRITLCGLGGVPLTEEKEFLLYQVQPGTSSFLLRYVVKR